MVSFGRFVRSSWLRPIVIGLSLTASASAQFGAYTWTEVQPDSPNNYVSQDSMYIEGLPIGFGYVDTYFHAVAPTAGTFVVDLTASMQAFGGGLGAYTFQNGTKTAICKSCTTSATLVVAAGDSFGFGLEANDFTYAQVLYSNLRFAKNPTVTSVSKVLAFLEQDVVITGTNFGADTTVVIDGVAEPIVSWTPTQLVIRPGKHDPGVFDLTVTNGGVVSYTAPGGLPFLPTLEVSGSTLGAPFSVALDNGSTANYVLLVDTESTFAPLPVAGIYYGLHLPPQSLVVAMTGLAPAISNFVLPDLPALAGTPFALQAVISQPGSPGGVAASFTNRASGVFGYPSTRKSLTIDNAQPASGDQFGAALARLSDLDGDGVDELAIGVPRSNEFAADAGSVRIHSGKTGTLLLSMLGSAPGGLFGGTLSSIADLDGDAKRDLVVGSLGAFVSVHSSATGQLLRSIPSQTHSVAGLDDLDGDGVPEIGVGFAPVGVRIYSGATGALLRQHVAPAFDQFGSSITCLGDLDQDSVLDYAAGAPHIQCVASAIAYVRVYSGATGAPLFFFSAPACTGFGASLADAGDVDGDGFPDLVVGAPAMNGTPPLNPQIGFVRILSGKDGSTLREISGKPPTLLPFAGSYGERFGSSVANGGDLNGDQVPDLLVGAPFAYPTDSFGNPLGALRAYSGAFGTPLYELKGNVAGELFGSSLTSIGSIDGDHHPEFAVGIPQAKYGAIHGGRVVVFAAIPQ